MTEPNIQGTSSIMEELKSNAHEFTVTEISQSIKKTVEDKFGHVRVRGEITGYRGPHSSGHAYFALKDEKARMDAVIWRGVFSKLAVKPEEGMEVIATGKLTTFPGSSKYQIVIEHIEPAGAGALMALLDKRRKQLMAEGLFDADRKQELPYLPQTIGVITSPTGAVIRDILHRLDDRFPTHVIVWPVRVQGDTCGAEVSRAIDGFNAIQPGGPIKRPDLLIVARGGGSIEDLWGFNDEVVVRAAAASQIPLISAVGHETDITLIDYASDKRAPTPTGAAEMAVPVKAELVAYVEDLGSRTRNAQLRTLSNFKDRMRAITASMPKPQDLTATARQRQDLATLRLGNALTQFIQQKRAKLGTIAPRVSANALEQKNQNLRERLTTLGGRLDQGLKQPTSRARLKLEPLSKSMDPAFQRLLDKRKAVLDTQSKLLNSFSYKGVLSRGYALVLDASGQVARSAGALKKGEGVTLRMHDGDLGAVIADAPTPKPKKVPKPEAKKTNDGQESLF
ncbi:exodeoxyribonuclease VII large subunit [Maritalea porphyrae]|nr:exodeoxyribonuclease VII large subunit [Maritalea porphyrae]MCZ4271421.1 exodeoxyribonuclease VII large subunit [Maritalea porphyrae]